MAAVNNHIEENPPGAGFKREEKSFLKRSAPGPGSIKEPAFTIYGIAEE
jgi:hypothetical protein